MIYKIVNPDTLKVEESYEAQDVLQYGGPWGSYPHIPVPEGLDPDCVKAELSGEEIILVEDPVLVAAKVVANKQARIAALNAQTWTTILTEAQIVYPDISINVLDWNGSSILILASHSTYEAMINNPADYVGDIFADQAAVLAYATPKLSASNAFGKWRIGILAAEAVQKAAILAE